MHRWNLFAVANYIMLLVYGLLLLGAMKFTIEKVSPGESLGNFNFFLFGLFTFVINSMINIYIYHRYLPEKPFSLRLKRLHRISTYSFAIGLAALSFNLLGEISTVNSNGDNQEFAIFLFCLLIFTLVLGLYVLINQIQLRAFIDKRINSKNDQTQY
jgi:hypothetical protein